MGSMDGEEIHLDRLLRPHRSDVPFDLIEWIKSSILKEAFVSSEQCHLVQVPICKDPFR